MSLKSVIESMPNEIHSFVETLRPDKLIDALKTAQKKYGKPVTGFFTGKLLFKRIPEPDFIKEHAQLSLAIILLGEGSFNLTSFKYLVLEALEFIPDNARAELAKLDKKLLETYLQNIYQLILSQLLSAEVIKGYSEALNNKPGEAFIDFLDRLSQYWVESIHSSADAAAGEGLSPLQFKLSPEAMDELCSQLEKMDDLSITTKSEPRADWPTRAFLLWGQKLKAASFECLDLRRKLYLPDEFKWQAFYRALKDSGITSLILSENSLHKLNKDQWQAFCEALKDSGITSLILSENSLHKLNKDQWQAFGEALKGSGITSLDLSWNEFDKLGESQWQAFGEALKGSGITSLDLSWNYFYVLNKDKWQAFCEALKGSGITSLILSKNDLHKLDKDQWQTIGEALKGSGITSLVLSRNDLNELDKDQWQTIGEALKGSGITSLDLSWNELDKLDESQWQAFGKALKDSGITSLILSWNYLNELDKDQWQTIGEALKDSGLTSLDLNKNNLSLSHWKMLLKALSTDRKTPLILKEINFSKFSEKEAQAFFQLLKRHYPAFKIYQPVPEGFEDLYESLSNLKKEITLLTSPASKPAEEDLKCSSALISKLDAEYDEIKYLNELDYLALFNEYYFAAFLLAKVGHQPQVALEALESINLTPVIDYPDKEQLNAELLHAVLDYALMLDPQVDEFAKAMHQATRKLFKQAGQSKDYYRAIFNQRTLDLDKVNTLLSEIKTMQKEVSTYLDSKVNAEANFFGKAPAEGIQKLNQHLEQFLTTLEEKTEDKAGILLR